MLNYKSYYIIALPYLGQLTNKQKLDHVNTLLETDHKQLIMPPISKDFTFLEHSFMYTTLCEWKMLLSTHSNKPC